MFSFTNNKMIKLREAVQTGNLEVVQEIIEQNGEFLDKPLNPGKLGVFSDVLEQIVPVSHQIRNYIYKDNRDSIGYTALHWAARAGQVAIIDYLLANGASIDIRNEIGNTPLHVAIYYNQPKATELLLQKGANPSIANDPGILCNEFNFTPLHYAVMYGTVSDVQLVIKYWNQNTTKSTRTIGGFSPLHMAAGLPSLEKLNALLAGDFNLNCQSDEKQTPLHLAILALTEHKTEAIKIIDTLVNKGASADIRDQNGNTPFDLLTYYLRENYELTTLDLFKSLFKNCLLNQTQPKPVPITPATELSIFNSPAPIPPPAPIAPPPPPVGMLNLKPKMVEKQNTNKTQKPIAEQKKNFDAQDLMKAIREQVEKRRLSIEKNDTNTEEETKAWEYKA